ncbi:MULTISPECIES: fimbrial biogenesis outer membrane usher protein [unclassified Citrobacter]|uniref:fimbrial biogenesis outer membrane usher protein n=1 Tax=unclassified Citrobacter TaxID=2644389 RepID=UPI001B9041A9|nr:fimbrial biogenesis outer membrane usher protein [Citrobacter sp. CK189]HBC9091826.1 fimbrial biogenesis outer membrane usher protein [Citrobacter koseri]MDM3017003.1 fimbrial biogenesis outer membrane usher protein [Citrobacter sp. CK189]HCR9735756.1 fimbrial biogenesis outer membrane usher protein [Citrobacter koseri]HEI8488157.1 fimbrial biogenesis outer membrane usher protein [Citrobacter koseri]HEM6872092.1 fimbrial biogenesis outer membrane usher protein [Citrobacter koseri]
MLRMTPLASAILLLLPGMNAYAAEETFDTHFMMGGMKGEKVSDFRLDDSQPLPGQYDIDIYVNQQWRGKYEVIVKDNPDDTCLSREIFTRLGINTEALNNAGECLLLKQAVQGGSYAWDIGTFRLNLSVPQAYVEELEQGYVPPENWDRGINAFYTSYYASQYYSDYKESGNSKSTYVRFNSGLNLLGWQLHSDASYSKSDDNRGEWKSNTLFLERGIPQILGTLRAGDMYTSSDIFDSVRFSGVRLYRDMQMLPNSKQNFTPLVQGIAQSNALVTIEQNGFVVYQKEVPPGPFSIADLQLAGGGADLDVSVKEADGSVTTYLVPYAAVPNMLQPGVSKYDFAAGRSHIEGASHQTDFAQISYQYGLNNLLTLYGGTMLADDYNAFTLGTGWNTRIGAISVDATKSHSKQDNGDVFDGQSYQIAYNKYLTQTATRFGLAAYRYSSREYRTFNDHVWANNKNNYRRDENDVYDITDYYQNDFGRKNSFSANVSQTLPEGWGSFSLSTLWRDYWGRSGNSKDYQLSYSSQWQRISYTFSASQTYDEDHHEDKRFNIFISIPFDWGDDITSPRRSLYVSNSTTFDDDGFASNNTGLSGTTGARDQFTYGVNLSHQRQNSETTAGTNLTWNAPVATLNGSYSQSSKYTQSSGSISGGVVAWSGGVNLANRLSETFAIMQAPGLEGAYANGQKYRTTNRNGVVIYDSLTPYRENHLMLDVSQSNSETELRGNRKITAPYRGAVVLTTFDTDQRKPWFIRAQRPDGSPLIFGYEVEDTHGHNIGVVGQGSQLFIRTNEIPPEVSVAVDKQQGLSCSITFDKEIDESKVYICR